MCGLAGIISSERDKPLQPALTRMMAVQQHRGPDGAGSWSGHVGTFKVALGHLRLSIIDLTQGGSQPMFLPGGSHGLIFNGEIYNYREIRSELEGLGVRFRSESDTEVVLWALAIWGKEAFSRFNGMWAIAWLDLNSSTLWLCRDRFGIKPLYFCHHEEALYFASEIKAILHGTGGHFTLNAQAIGRYLHQGLLDAQSETMFAGIKALPPGKVMELSLADPQGPYPESTLTDYWTISANEPLRRGQEVEALRETFLSAVGLRLRSDVPVGVCLSGGVDSSSIAAAMRLYLGPHADLHAISAVSGRPEYDETRFIEDVRQHLDCTVHYVSLNHHPKDWFDLLETVTYSNDEPVLGFAAVGHYLLMERAKELGVTVILSGQGGDESLCGYFKFLGFYLQGLAREGHWLSAARVLASFLRNGTVLSQFQMSEAKRYLPSVLKLPEIDICGPRLESHDFHLATGLGDGSLSTRQCADLFHFSVPALVHYEDRTSMAWSREIRLPFLDYRLVQLLLSLGPEWKLRDGWTKWVFRKAVEPWLPSSIAWRKDKQGFSNPQAEWLRCELRDTIEKFLGGDLVAADMGLIDRRKLTQRYRAYCEQSRGRGRLSFKDVFNPIALEIWARRFYSSIALA